MLKKFDHGGDIYSRPVDLDFSININPLGMPAAVRDALMGAVENFDVYPDPQCRQLTARLSRFLDVPPQWLLFGNGAADLVIRLCLSSRPKRALVCAPTFSEYEKSALMAGAAVENHGLLSGILQAGDPRQAAPGLQQGALPDGLHTQSVQGQPDLSGAGIRDVVVVRQRQPHPLRHRG